MVNFITIPAVCILLVLANPIVQGLFERGAFQGQRDAVVRGSAAVCRGRAVALAANIVLTRCCFACRETRWTSLISVVTVDAERRALADVARTARRARFAACKLGEPIGRRRCCCSALVWRLLGGLDWRRSCVRRWASSPVRARDGLGRCTGSPRSAPFPAATFVARTWFLVGQIAIAGLVFLAATTHSSASRRPASRWRLIVQKFERHLPTRRRAVRSRLRTRARSPRRPGPGGRTGTVLPLRRVLRSDFVRHGSIVFASSTVVNLFNYVFHFFMSRRLGVVDYGGAGIDLRGPRPRLRAVGDSDDGRRALRGRVQSGRRHAARLRALGDRVLRLTAIVGVRGACARACLLREPIARYLNIGDARAIAIAGIVLAVAVVVAGAPRHRSGSAGLSGGSRSRRRSKPAASSFSASRFVIGGLRPDRRDSRLRRRRARQPRLYARASYAATRRRRRSRLRVDSAPALRDDARRRAVHVRADQHELRRPAARQAFLQPERGRALRRHLARRQGVTVRRRLRAHDRAAQGDRARDARASRRCRFSFRRSARPLRSRRSA